jgi:RNA polymerase sigma-70 factor (ECF subfamily)
LVIDHYRKKTSTSLEGLSEQGYEPAINENISGKVDSKMAYDKALQLLSKIDEKYREAVLLRYVEDLSPRQIAEIIGESENVVSVRIHRGVEKLRKLLDNK